MITAVLFFYNTKLTLIDSAYVLYNILARHFNTELVCREYNSIMITREVRMFCYEPDCIAWWTNIVFKVDPTFGIVIALDCQAYADILKHHLEFPIRTGHNTGVLRLSNDGTTLGSLIVHRPDNPGLRVFTKAQIITEFGDRLLRICK